MCETYIYEGKVYIFSHYVRVFRQVMYRQDDSKLVEAFDRTTWVSSRVVIELCK